MGAAGPRVANGRNLQFPLPPERLEENDFIVRSSSKRVEPANMAVRQSQFHPPGPDCTADVGQRLSKQSRLSFFRIANAIVRFPGPSEIKISPLFGPRYQAIGRQEH